jgi:glycosyltransferase involved in cell wall biosynthesis
MPSSQPQITIVVPVHNRKELVKQTLQSIEAQTLRPLAVVLIDNNSTDGTIDTLQQWRNQVSAPDFIVEILSETKPGAAAARNRGLSVVTTPYTMFFDSDDLMAPGHVQRAVEALSNTDTPTIVGWDIKITTTTGSTFIKPFYATDAMWHCIMHGSMATQRYAAHTTLFRRAGAWNAEIMGWNDIELGARLLTLHPQLLKLHGEPTVEVRQQRESITGIDFSSTAAKWERALQAIQQTVTTRRHKRYVDLRRALLSGNYAAEGNNAEASRLLTAVVTAEPCPFYRLLYRFAHTYTAHHGRAGARLLRPFF